MNTFTRYSGGHFIIIEAQTPVVKYFLRHVVAVNWFDNLGSRSTFVETSYFRFFSEHFHVPSAQITMRFFMYYPL